MLSSVLYTTFYTTESHFSFGDRMESPTHDADSTKIDCEVHHPNYQRKIAFRREFNRGARWSLILALPLAVVVFVDTYNAYSTRNIEGTESSVQISLSWLDILLCSISGLAAATVLIILPVAFLFAIVGVLRRSNSTRLRE